MARSADMDEKTDVDLTVPLCVSPAVLKDRKTRGGEGTALLRTELLSGGKSLEERWAGGVFI